jgi:uncharacterized protein with von Willebrand factor type A (vWA) domain
MKRLLSHFDKSIWLNPQEERQWSYHSSIDIMKSIVANKMYPLTVEGLTQGIKALL